MGLHTHAQASVSSLSDKPQPTPGLALSSCDREPIHIPGSIQPHGFLLALDAAGRVATASSNAPHCLQVGLDQIFGATLPELLGDQDANHLTEALAAEPLTAASHLLGSINLHGSPFEVVAYTAPSGPPQTILEFEESREPVDIPALNARLYNFVGEIRRLRTLDGIAQAAVDEIYALTGCGRVVLYRFGEEGHGLVLAESLTSPAFTSYLGLRFPASDVPAQARRLYELNRVRIIPNLDYEPSPLIGAAPGMDLSPSVLRSVSPVHREYMRNMGTACSMSVSIILDGKLWGLVSCHHPTPRYLPLRLRSACDFLMQIVASQIESRENAERLNRALRAKSAHGSLLASMAAQESYMEGLIRAPGPLRELVDADGAAVVAGGTAQLFGVTPPEEQILDFVHFLRKNKQDDFFSTQRLADGYPPAAAFAANGAGVIAFSVSRLHNTCVLWFRREQVETVRWAGNPHKPAEDASGSAHPGLISPRHSFEEWKETVRGTARAWTAEEMDAARDFRAAILEIVLGRAEELAGMTHDLQVANGELEAFSYSVSHDLRAPFRHISGFAELLKEEEGSRLSVRGRRHLETILESARFAGLLVDSLLEFSRFARATLQKAVINMEELADKEWEAVMYDEAGGRAIQFTRGPLPRVLGDPQLLRQVLRNLFSNAAKYTARQEHPIVWLQAKLEGQEFVFSIRDNGVGFDGQFAGKLFGVFQRLHRAEEFEGTGIGLANVKRIITRHGGRVWAEGESGKGAAFFFSLPAIFPAEGA